MLAGFLVTEMGRRSPKPSLRWESVMACKHQVLASEMGDKLLGAEHKREFGRVQRSREACINLGS